MLETALVAESPARPWSLGRKLAFRFVSAYFLLYCLPFPLDHIPWVSRLAARYDQLWNLAVTWVGKACFGLDILVQRSGSGDRPYNYVLSLIYVALALLATLVWTWLDRRRPDYRRLWGWLWLYFRFALAATLFVYGTGKVFRAQFGDLTFDRLLQPLGRFSPMGLLWNFMGASYPYSFFTGLAEILPGLLLTMRRTALLGALLSAVAMTQVLMLNLSYDVPVKLFSAHLLVLSLLLAAADRRRLVSFFVLDRPTPAAGLPSPWPSRRLQRGAMAVGTLLVLVFTAQQLHQARQHERSRPQYQPRPPFYGIWKVEAMSLGSDTPLSYEALGARFKYLVVQWPDYVLFQTMDDRWDPFLLAVDESKKTIELTLEPESESDPKVSYLLTYTQPDADHLVLEGSFRGEALHLRAKRLDDSAFRLKSRGFHWITEVPFNR